MRRSPRTTLSLPLRALIPAAALAAVGSLVLGSGPAVARSGDGAPIAALVTVAVDARGPAGTTVPSDFLGLSLEARVLATTQTDGRYGNLAGLLRSLGAGTLRFGGDSVDSAAYLTTATAKKPSWADSVIRPTDFDRLATLTQASGWKVILGVNLRQYNPQVAAAEVADAAARLGASLLAVEVGNEPNAYASRDPQGHANYGASDYQSQFGDYRDAIAASAPGVPVVGPSSYVNANPPGFVNAFDPGLAVPGTFLAQHVYPLNNCKGPTPTIPQLLDRYTATRELVEINQGLGVAEAHAIPLRLTESNSVICSGTPGVSNTHGAALWGVDYLGQAAARGVAGVNLHGGLQDCSYPASPWYTPLCAAGPDALAANQFTAQPIWYAMQLMSRLAGSSFVRTTYSTPQNVVVRATRDAAGVVHAVMNNMDPPGTADSVVRLELPVGFDEALVQRLSAPSVDATTGTTLGGAQVAPDGSLPAGPAERFTGRGGVIYVRVPAGTVAVATLEAHCTVPAVRGLTLVQARVKLLAGGCRSGLIATPRVKPGTPLVIKRQALPAGFRYRFGQPVHLQLVAKPLPPKKPPVRRPPAPAPTPPPRR